MSKYSDKWYRGIEIIMALIGCGLIVFVFWYVIKTGALDAVLHGQLF